MKCCHYLKSFHIQELERDLLPKKNASTYTCFVPDHLEIEFIWISVQCLQQFKKQTEVIISCKLILKYSKNNRKPKQAIKTFQISNRKIIKAGLL